jgi:hypothetical protein
METKTRPFQQLQPELSQTRDIPDRQNHQDNRHMTEEILNMVVMVGGLGWETFGSFLTLRWRNQVGWWSGLSSSYLPSKHKALSSNPSIAKKKRWRNLIASWRSFQIDSF